MIGKSISEEVSIAIDKKLPFSSMTIGSSQISYQQLYELVDFARSTAKPIERLYRRPGSQGAGRWIWRGYSHQNALFNVRLIYENVGDVYQRFIELNGMDYETLKPFSNATKLVIFYAPPKNPQSDTPTISQYHLASNGEPVGKPSISVLEGAGLPIERDGSGRPTVKFEGNTYRLQWHSVGEASFVFQKLPMLSLVYKTLEQKLTDALGGSERL